MCETSISSISTTYMCASTKIVFFRTPFELQESETRSSADDRISFSLFPKRLTQFDFWGVLNFCCGCQDFNILDIKSKDCEIHFRILIKGTLLKKWKVSQKKNVVKHFNLLRLDLSSHSAVRSPAAPRQPQFPARTKRKKKTTALPGALTITAAVAEYALRWRAAAHQNLLLEQYQEVGSVGFTFPAANGTGPVLKRLRWARVWIH